MGFFDRFRRKPAAASPAPGAEFSIAPPEWRAEFDRKRETFLHALRDAVAGAGEIESRFFDAEDGYQRFSEWVDGKVVYHERGSLREAEEFCRHLIDEGHVVAFAINRDGARARICVSYDGDRPDWSPTWPPDFRVDVSQVSSPMTREW
jgi:hypothetical protein